MKHTCAQGGRGDPPGTESFGSTSPQTLLKKEKRKIFWWRRRQIFYLFSGKAAENWRFGGFHSTENLKNRAQPQLWQKLIAAL